jgi:excisionase family DNA binding protein
MNKLLMINEVAAVLGLKVKTVYQYVSRRKIPFMKMGRLLRFDEKALNEWISANMTKEGHK